jgi:hypothetical protein
LHEKSSRNHSWGLSESQSLIICPNPSNADEITLTSNLISATTAFTLSIFNELEQKVTSQQIKSTVENLPLQVSISNHSPEVYWLELNRGNDFIWEQLAKL